MLHSSYHKNYPISLVTTHLKYCKHNNMEEIIKEDPDITGKCVLWGEMDIKTKNSKVEHPFQYLHNIMYKKITTHTVKHNIFRHTEHISNV